jgi:hypothetical protein
MPLDIPQEQLVLIQPVVEELSAGIRRLIGELPFDAQSALTFSPDGEERS